MLLAVDVGNTNTVLGLYEGDTLVENWRVATDRKRMADEYAVMLKGLLELGGYPAPQQAIISSVVTPVEKELAYALERYWQAPSSLVSSDSLAGILQIETDDPREVGADMLVNSVAALRYDAEAIIIVDFGTATTFNLLLKPNRFLGVAIAPGPMTAADALSSKTAQLPRVDLSAPAKAIGTDTIGSLKSGLVFGYASLVDGMVARFIEESDPAMGKPLVISTGGFAKALEGLCRNVDVVDPLLTLEGLRLLAEYQQR